MVTHGHTSAMKFHSLYTCCILNDKKESTALGFYCVFFLYVFTYFEFHFMPQDSDLLYHSHGYCMWKSRGVSNQKS